MEDIGNMVCYVFGCYPSENSRTCERCGKEISLFSSGDLVFADAGDSLRYHWANSSQALQVRGDARGALGGLGAGIVGVTTQASDREGATIQVKTQY